MYGKAEQSSKADQIISDITLHMIKKPHKYVSWQEQRYGRVIVTCVKWVAYSVA